MDKISINIELDIAEQIALYFNNKLTPELNMLGKSLIDKVKAQRELNAIKDREIKWIQRHKYAPELNTIVLYGNDKAIKASGVQTISEGIDFLKGYQESLERRLSA